MYVEYRLQLSLCLPVIDSHIFGLVSGFKFSQLEMSPSFDPFFFSLLTYDHLSEVVLSILVSSFKISFAKESKDVVWNAATVRYPTVGKECLKPSYPLAIERIKN